MAKNFFICSFQFNNLIFRVSYLEPELPLKRMTAVHKTKKLFPFDTNIPHRTVKNEDELWQMAAKSNIELQVFSVGLILTD